MKEYTVRFHFDMVDKKIDEVGHIVARNTEELHSKMLPFRYEVIGVRLFKGGSKENNYQKYLSFLKNENLGGMSKIKRKI